jgi:hypothetical protein
MGGIYEVRHWDWLRWHDIHSKFHEGFEDFSAMVMKSAIFLAITPFNPLSVNRRFGETNRLHLQGLRRICSARNQGISRWLMEAICSSETSVTLNGLHCLVSQKIVFFKFHEDRFRHSKVVREDIDTDIPTYR